MAAIKSDIVLVFEALSTAAQEALQSSDIDEKYRMSSNPSKVVIRCSHRPRNSNLGFTFGKKNTCDFPFTQQRSISRLHFHITFNKSSGYPIIKDSSSSGTIVESKITGKRTLHQSYTPIFTEDLIQIGFIRLRIIIPSYDENEYAKNWQAWRQSFCDTLPIFDDLNIYNQNTTNIETRHLCLLIDDEDDNTSKTAQKAVDYQGNLFMVKSHTKGLSQLSQELKVLKNLSHVS